MLIGHREAAKEGASNRRAGREADPLKSLVADERRHYKLLRDWRGLRANADSVPLT